MARQALRQPIDALVSARVRPACYRFLSRRMAPGVFDPLVALAVTGAGCPAVERIESAAGRFLFGTGDRARVLEGLERCCPGASDDAVSRADEIVDHVFRLFGEDPVALGDRIDWHADFKSGIRWSPCFYRDIVSMNPTDASDIRLPWELNRFHHLNVLGWAYWVTNDERYTRAFVEQVTAWIAVNPPRIGINWYFAMEVGIRLINWVSAFVLFRESSGLTSGFKQRFFESVRVQLLFIYCNLELEYHVRSRRVSAGNHYLVGLAGLIVAGAVFPSLLPARLRRRAAAWLSGEVLRQVNREGVHFELSVGYHRFVAEALLCAARVLDRNGRHLDREVTQRIEKMLEFTGACIRPDGTAPPLRDADEGRILTFDASPHVDHGYLLNIGAVQFGRRDLTLTVPAVRPDALWWTAGEAGETLRERDAAPPPDSRKAYTDSGFYFVREGGTHLAGVCAGVGGDAGSHGHNDALSFVLRVNGVDVLADPGTCTYSGDLDVRDALRSTAAHNTVRVDGREINPVEWRLPFVMEENAAPRFERWVARGEGCAAVASHTGFGTAAAPLVHRRLVAWQPHPWRVDIVDHVHGSGRHRVEVFFHFGPEIVPVVDETGARIVLRGPGEQRFELAPGPRASWEVVLEEDFVSPSYGTRWPSRTACYVCTASLPFKAAFCLERMP